MSRAFLTGEIPSPWLPLVPPKAVPALIARLNDILKREAEALGDVYVALPVETLETNGGFGDEGHFTEEGSLLFTTLLAPAVAENCR